MDVGPAQLLDAIERPLSDDCDLKYYNTRMKHYSIGLKTALSLGDNVYNAKYANAISSLQSSVDIVSQLLGESDENVIVGLRHLALSLDKNGEYEKAIVINRRALSLLHNGQLQEGSLHSHFYNQLEMINDNLGKYDEAIINYRKSYFP